MQVALWKRNLDTVFGQLAFQCPKIGGPGFGGTSGTLPINPNQQQEIQAVVAKFHQPDISLTGFRIAQRIGHFFRCFHRRLLHFFLIAAIGHAEWNSNAQRSFAKRPVRKTRGDELGIRHDDVDVVVRIDKRAAYVDGFNSTGESGVEFNVITDAQ